MADLALWDCCAVCLLITANSYVGRFLLAAPVTDETAWQVMSVFPFLCWFVPTVLWSRYGLSSESEMKAQWTRIRSRIFLLYAPAVLIDGYFMFMVFRWDPDRGTRLHGASTESNIGLERSRTAAHVTVPAVSECGALPVT